MTAKHTTSLSFRIGQIVSVVPLSASAACSVWGASILMAHSWLLFGAALAGAVLNIAGIFFVIKATPESVKGRASR